MVLPGPARRAAIASAALLALGMRPAALHGAGACCLDDGSCLETPSSIACAAIGGSYLGEGGDCATASCLGACCLPNAACLDGSRDACLVAGGSFEGFGSDCAAAFCGLGACCFPDESCADVSVADCRLAGGFPLGEGSLCSRTEVQARPFLFSLSPNSQTLVFERFDDDGGTRVLQRVTAVLDGRVVAHVSVENLSPDLPFSELSLSANGTLNTFFAGLTPLQDAPEDIFQAPPGTELCPSDGVPGSGCDFYDFGPLALYAHDDAASSDPGALVLYGGGGTFDVAVFGTGQYSCLSGALAFVVDPFFADGTIKLVYEFVAEGACCFADGTCTSVLETECAALGGAYGGDGAPCDVATCKGACCLADGACVDGVAADVCGIFGGFYQGDGSECLDASCPTGACCLPDATCDELLAVACAAAGGVYQGEGTSCLTNPCPVLTGACCLVDGACVEVTPPQCEALSGTYAGAGTLCDGSACVGACCRPAGSCVEAPAAACLASGGVFQGTGSACAESACGAGACVLDDGSCLDDTAAACAAVGGVHLGEGTVCDALVVQTRSFSLDLPPNEASLPFDLFDDRAGNRVLERVVTVLRGCVLADVAVENTAPERVPAPAIVLDGAVSVRFKGFEAIEVVVQAGFEAPPGTELCPADGVPGAGCDLFDYGVLSASGSAVLERTEPVVLRRYTGSGGFWVVVAGEAGVSVASGLPFDLHVGSLVAEGAALLVYVYRERCPYDLDGDGAVGLADLRSLLLRPPGDGGARDGNLDPGTSAEEIARLLDAWGPCPSAR